MRITGFNPKLNANINRSRIGERFSQYHVIVNTRGGMREVITVEVRATVATHHCNLWVKDLNNPASGYGKAGGYGYNKEAAAVEDALISAGFDIDPSTYVNGVRSVLEAVVHHLGYNGQVLVVGG